jgi:hypothetical protein
MRVTIHQPEFMPWLGFFHKASLADVLVLLDDAQFTKNYFHNRNRVRTKTGSSWITIPVEKDALATPLNEIRIAEAHDPRWRDKIETTIQQAYTKAPRFLPAFDELSGLLSAPGTLLTGLNIPIIEWMLDAFGLHPQILRSSEMGIDSTASQRILDICQHTGAATYVSGVSGVDYLDITAFAEAGIAIEHQVFHHPIYPQLFPEFAPQMSAIEALFLFGADSGQLLKDAWPEKIDQVFA